LFALLTTRLKSPQYTDGFLGNVHKSAKSSCIDRCRLIFSILTAVNNNYTHLSLSFINMDVSSSSPSSSSGSSSTIQRAISIISLPYDSLHSILANFVQQLSTIMGNLWGSSSSSKPSVEQPKIFGRLPNPYPIAKIAPVLLIYPTTGKDYCLCIDSSYSAGEAVDLLLSKNCLDGSQRLVVITHGFRSDKVSEVISNGL